MKEEYFKVLDLFFESKNKGILVIGRSGIGKTLLTLEYLAKNKIKYDLISGYVSPMMFYKKLYENRKGVLVLDDVLNLFEDKQIISLLLSALDYTKAKVCWVSNAVLNNGLPEEFEFRGKIIIIRNQVNGDGEIFRALINRCIVYKMQLSREDILREIEKERKYKELAEWVRQNLLDVNFRNWELAKRIYEKFENWEEMIRKLLIDYDGFDEIDRVILQIFEKHKSLSNNMKAKLFTEKTGMHRATFFRRLKYLKSLGLI